MSRFIVRIVFFLVLALSMAAQRADCHIAVLCYHHVDLSQDTPYSVSSEQLVSQMQALRKAGFSFVTLQQIEDYCYKGVQIPSKCVAITFDDGNHNTYTKAFPLFQKMKIPFAIFVYPSAIGVGHERGFMNWEDVKGLARAGVTVGCHAWDHPYLSRPPADIQTPKAYEDWLEKECRRSRETIESHVGVSVNYFALPFGLSDQKVYQTLKKLGYKMVFNVSGMTNALYADPYDYNRQIIVKTDSADEVVQKASVRPIYFTKIYPERRARIQSNDFNASFQIFSSQNYEAASIQFLLGSLTKNAYHVQLKHEADYVACVLSRDKRGNSCMGNWPFIYTKKHPTHLE